jgi:hypothetical protein
MGSRRSNERAKTKTRKDKETRMQFENKRTYKVMTPVPKKDGSTFWMRIGTGYPGKDGALNLYLDALPATRGDKTMIYVREMDERDFERRDANAARTDRRPAPAAGTTDDLPF